MLFIAEDKQDVYENMWRLVFVFFPKNRSTRHDREETLGEEWYKTHIQ